MVCLFPGMYGNQDGRKNHVPKHISMQKGMLYLISGKLRCPRGKRDRPNQAIYERLFLGQIFTVPQGSCFLHPLCNCMGMWRFWTGCP